jgi:hypothetical protein
LKRTTFLSAELPVEILSWPVGGTEALFVGVRSRVDVGLPALVILAAKIQGRTTEIQTTYPARDHVLATLVYRHVVMLPPASTSWHAGHPFTRKSQFAATFLGENVTLRVHTYS